MRNALPQTYDAVMQPCIMYIENKADGLNGPARIGLVSYSKTGATLYYAGKSFRSLKGGYKANYFDIETGEEYWISGCKKCGGDRLYPGLIEIDEDIREAYWRDMRDQPERCSESTVRCNGKYQK